MHICLQRSGRERGAAPRSGAPSGGQAQRSPSNLLVSASAPGRPRSRSWFGRQRSRAALSFAHRPAVATPGWGWGWGQPRLGWEGGESARASGKGWGGGGRGDERVSPSPPLPPRRRRVASGQPASPGCGRGSGEWGGGLEKRAFSILGLCLGFGVGGRLRGSRSGGGGGRQWWS